MKHPLLVFFLVISITKSSYSQTYNYDFSTGYEGWMGDFADYPVTDSIFYKLDFSRETLPAPLNIEKYALKISGKNHSDDLFMFIKRKISGLQPNTTYQLEFDINFASKAPTNAVGVGGAPGEGVTMKAGASVIEPVKVASNGFYFMNIDKSNQRNRGKDMDTIGHIGVSDTTTVFTLISRTNANRPFIITTDANGEVWVCIGTDSGFEATTTLYYNRIALNFSIITGTNDLYFHNHLKIYPNPVNHFLNIDIDQNMVGEAYIITDQFGRICSRGKLNTMNTTVDFTRFSKGAYFIQIGDKKRMTYKIINE